MSTMRNIFSCLQVTNGLCFSYRVIGGLGNEGSNFNDVDLVTEIDGTKLMKYYVFNLCGRESIGLEGNTLLLDQV